MHTLTKLYLQKISRQKLIYIFFACFFIASFFYAFLISTPQMEEMLNINIKIVGSRNFPEFMMRFYVGTPGILFQVFLLTAQVCEEEENKVLYLPLLHGKSRTEILKSKAHAAVSMSTVSVLMIAVTNYTTAFTRWGCPIFETGAFLRIVGKYLLSAIYMSCVTLAVIFLCICTRNTWKTIFITVIYLLADSFICGSSFLLLKRIWIGYYPNLWMFTYEYQKIPIGEALWAIVIMTAYGILFYRIALHRIKKMNF